jgi:hypothetical protein
MSIKQYILQRVAELDGLIAKEKPGSSHAYALQAGKFELLRLASALTL